MKHVGIEGSAIDRFSYLSLGGSLWGMGLMCLGLGVFTMMPLLAPSLHGNGHAGSRSVPPMVERGVSEQSTGDEARSPGTLFIYSFEPWGGVASGSPNSMLELDSGLRAGGRSVYPPERLPELKK